MHLRRSLWVVDGKRGLELQIHRVGVYHARTVGTDHGRNGLFYSPWEDETAVIVGMLAYQIDASRGSVGGATVPETAFEFIV